MASNFEIQDEDDDEDDDDINYANVQTKTTARLKHPRRKHPRMTRSVRRRYRLVVLGFGLLCGVQALLNIGLRLSLYSELVKGQEQLQSRNKILTEQNVQIQSKYDNLTKNNDDLLSKYDNLTKNNDDLQSRYDSVTAERDELGKKLCETHGFTFSGGVCYHISTSSATWEKSRKYCRDKQSDMMIINNKEKQDFVNRFKWVWLGLTDREEEGVWKWVDGTTLSSPTYWHSGEPNNYEDQDCVVSSNGFWEDTPCSKLNRCICERVF